MVWGEQRSPVTPPSAGQHSDGLKTAPSLIISKPRNVTWNSVWLPDRGVALQELCTPEIEVPHDQADCRRRPCLVEEKPVPKSCYAQRLKSIRSAHLFKSGTDWEQERERSNGDQPRNRLGTGERRAMETSHSGRLTDRIQLLTNSSD